MGRGEGARGARGTRVVRLKRVYDPPEPELDGVRVLVDRLWPRGLSKEAAGVRGHLPAVAGGEWAKAVAPSGELRKWFHGGGSVAEFRERYAVELRSEEAGAELSRLRAVAAGGPVTLLTAVKDPEASHVGVLAALLQSPS
ncbi:DUF488 domain-containing protein [Streptomyces sp. AP-93]|uniref:DUF488 domain-containing protein n=1 Tax=Streptomyces sp. AP-93 TaxID=2929048 RepID=UPI001FAF74D5|nr:DUF488 family protein [Streptomyces sp. AP-93]MCJ0872233.1 DUF488 family protein [Streptomyces sp. AP-93]